MGLPALGGLFDTTQCPHLASAQIENRWLLTAVFQNALTVDGGDTGEGWGAMFIILSSWFLLSFISLWPVLAMAVKRAHGRGRPGAFVLVMLIPLIGLWPAVELAFLDGTPGPNQYGSSPKGLGSDLPPTTLT